MSWHIHISGGPVESFVERAKAGLAGYFASGDDNMTVGQAKAQEVQVQHATAAIDSAGALVQTSAFDGKHVEGNIQGSSESPVYVTVHVVEHAVVTDPEVTEPKDVNGELEADNSSTESLTASSEEPAPAEPTTTEKTGE